MTHHSLNDVVNQYKNPLGDIHFRQECKSHLDRHGALVLSKFITPRAIESLKQDGINNKELAYYTASSHNIYLTPPDPKFSEDHTYNRQINSSKGCITTDQIPSDSMLHTLYNADEFKSFFVRCAF